jgi:prepilin-type N-terminal cleavage/methylation domain-containing protein
MTTMTLSMHGRRRGFSMLELVVVLVVMGLAGSVAMTSIGRTLAASKIDRTAGVIVAEIHKARSLAGRVRTPMIFTVNGGGRRIRIIEHGTGTVHSDIRFNSSSELGVQRLHDGGDTQVTIFPNGLADGTLAISIRENGHRRQITMTRAGQVRVITPTS